MTEVGNKRLQKLADFLKIVDEAQFDLRDWRSDGFDMDNPEHSSCGSTACAVGWACTIPEFRAEGLTIGGSGSPSYRTEAVTYEHWYAVQAFFGLSCGESYELFSALEYEDDSGKVIATPADVIKRIEDLLVKGGRA